MSKYSSVIGKLMFLIGGFTLIPLFVVPFYPSEVHYMTAFLYPALLSMGCGILMRFLPNKKQESSRQHQRHVGSVIVVLAWLWGIFIGALPFVLSSSLTWVQALFEAVSGWTTTGLSVMNVQSTPMILLFHRSFMQFCGGLGFILMMLVFVQDRQSMVLYDAEGHPDRLMPNIRKTSQTIFMMYFAFLIIGTLAYCLVKMPFFDAINHAMCALSTGGFSIKLNSIGEYNSLSIEIITILLMLIGTTNFSVLLICCKGKWKHAFQISEFRFMFKLLLVFVPLVAWNLSSFMNISLLEGLRRSFFDVSSALSTTGFSTMSYTLWPTFSVTILILMMLIGGGMGSTAGGIKMTRVYLMLKITLENIKNRIFAQRKVNVLTYIKPLGKTEITPALKQDTFSFLTLYLVIFMTGTLGLILSENCSLMEAMFEFSSALGTVGLSIGITGPSTQAITLIIEMIGMLMGRLEIFVVLIAIVTTFQKGKSEIIKLAKKVN